MLPVIGITCGLDEPEEWILLRRNYLDAVLRARGIPVVIPAAGGVSPERVRKYSRIIHGLLLSGGGDVDPVHFDEEMLEGTGRIDPERDGWEIFLVREFIRLNKPVLAICRGMQVLNIAAGGSVYQDISEIGRHIKHDQQAPRRYPVHEIAVEPETLLYGILDSDTVRVNSLHHQCIKKVGWNLRVCARANDGIIEAVESKGSANFVLGVQWHPESMCAANSVQQRIFGAFIRAAVNFLPENEGKT